MMDVEVDDICKVADAIVIDDPSIPIYDGQENSNRKLTKVNK